MIRQTKYGYPVRAPRVQESRASIFDPTLGFDGGQHAAELSPGYTPSSQNWVHDGGYLAKRSGLSYWPSITVPMQGPVLGGIEWFDVNQNRHAIGAGSAFSNLAVTLNNPWAYLAPDASDWTSIVWSCWTTDSTESANQAPSNIPINIGVQSASFYEPNSDERWAVFTTDQNLPKFITSRVTSLTTTANAGLYFSDLTTVASQFSHAKSVCEFDFRLVWFNVSTSSLSFPQRVFWSARGAPLENSVANGAGFEDLLDMRGAGIRVVPDTDSIVLFTAEQIWRGRKRTDAYAFDFYPIIRDLGCPFWRTIVVTPFGIVFLGNDFELYLLNGDQPIPLGPAQPGGHSRVQSYLRNLVKNPELAHAVYNTQDKRYELFYAHHDDTSMWPRRAMYYSFENQSFFQQVYDQNLTFSLEILDAGAPTWDSIDVSWDEYNVAWDDPLDAGARRVSAFAWHPNMAWMLPLSFHSATPSDLIFNDNVQSPVFSVTSIDCRWRSHGLGQADAFRYEQLNGVRLETVIDVVSTISVAASSNMGSTFPEVYGLSISEANDTPWFPVVATGRSPMFEVRHKDFSSQPRISRIRANLSDAGEWNGVA